MSDYGWGKVWQDNYVNHGCPCTKECPKRKQGCHSECAEYIEWFNARNDRLDRIYEAKKDTRMFNHYYVSKKEGKKYVSKKK